MAHERNRESLRKNGRSHSFHPDEKAFRTENRDYWSTDTGSEEEDKPNYAGVGPKNYIRSDERIQEEVCEMLTRHSSIDASNIEVYVRSGIVTLDGTVPENSMIPLAEEVAATCHFVSGVKNNLREVFPTDTQPTEAQ